MRERYFLLLLTVLMVGCVCAGCFVQQPGTSQLAEMPNVTTIPNTVPASSTSPAATIATTAPADHPFDPKEYAAQISESLEREMRQALADQNFPHDPSGAEEAVFRRVFGVFGDTYVLFIDGYGYACVETEETVNGLEFLYSNGQLLQVYANGHFYTLQEALMHRSSARMNWPLFMKIIIVHILICRENKHETPHRLVGRFDAENPLR